MTEALLGTLILLWREPHWVVTAVVCGCVLRAIWIAALYKPTKAKLLADGYRDARRDRNAAIFLGERAPMPFTVDDEIVFVTDRSEIIRLSIRRWAEPRGDSSLIWYLPRKPERVSSAGPVGWLSFGMFALSTLLMFK